MHTKTSSATKPAKPLSRTTAVHCVIVNQAATPGLGSLLARRWIAGSGQLALALAGFGLIMAWFFFKLRDLYRLAEDLPVDPSAGNSLGKAGLVIFVLAWLWSWVTSASILKEARKNAAVSAD